MTFKITEDCVSCGTCVDECPVGAIKEADGKYSIDQEICTQCGACKEVCPVEAIVEEG